MAGWSSSGRDVSRGSLVDKRLTVDQEMKVRFLPLVLVM